MCEQVAPYLQLSGDLGTVALSTVEDRFNLISPVLRRLDQGVKNYGTNWVMKRAWMALDKTGVKKAQLKQVELNVVNGWATGPIVDSFTGEMRAAGSIPRTPGRYGEKKLGMTNEMIHPCVKYRMEKDTKYKPLPLDGFSRALLNENEKGFLWANKRGLVEEKKNGYAWKKGEVIIPEYIIKPEDSFTRHVAMQDCLIENGASDFIGRIDRDIGANSSEADFLTTREESIKRRDESQ